MSQLANVERLHVFCPAVHIYSAHQVVQFLCGVSVIPEHVLSKLLFRAQIVERSAIGIDCSACS